MRMNFVTSIAYLVIAAFIYLIVTRLTDNPKIFLNLEGIVVVCLGLVIATFASFPWGVLKDCGHALKRAFFTPVRMPIDEARQIVRLSILGQRGFARLEGEIEAIENPFLKQGAELILEGVKLDAFVGIMHKRINEYQERVARASNVLLTCSKYSPALGLAATVLGLVQLLDKLGAADLGVLGASMAIALTATFYGLMLANFVFTPLAELLQTRGELDIKEREMITDGLRSFLERQEPLTIGEIVNSYMPEEARIPFSEEMETLSQDKSGAAQPAPQRGAAA